MFRCRHQPRRRVVRNSAQVPDFERPAEGVLGDILGEREVVHAEDARQRRDESARLAPEKMLFEVHLTLWLDVEAADRTYFN